MCVCIVAWGWLFSAVCSGGVWVVVDSVRFLIPGERKEKAETPRILVGGSNVFCFVLQHER